MKRLKKVLLVIFALTFLFSVFKVGKVLASTEDFKLTGVEIVDKSSDVTADITSFDDDKIVTDVTFHKVGSYYTLKLSVKNNTDKDYTIETISDTNANEYIELSYDKHENETLASKGTLLLDVKATYKVSVNDKNKRDQVNEYSITIKLIGEDGKEEEKDIPVVPITSDNLALYIILAITSLIVLMLTGIYGKKNFKKSMLVLILLLPLIVKAITINVVINVKENLKLYDKVVVTLNRDGEKEEKLIDYNSTISTPPAPTKEGHTFKGWTKNNEIYDFSKSFTEDTELVATYEKNKYDVSYEYFDDSANKTISLPALSQKEYASSVTVADALVLAGYTFDGWYKGTDKVTTFTMPAEAVVLKGRLTPNDNTPYRVEYYYQVNGAYPTETGTYTVRTGTTDTNVSITEADKTSQQDGYVLDDSRTNDYSGNLDGDGNLKLKVYFKQKFSVTYAPGTKGTFAETTTSNLDYNADTPSAPSVTGKDGYTHTGWDPVISSKVTQTVTYVAQWVANQNTPYTVEYYYQTNGSYSNTPDSSVNRTGTTDTTAEVTDEDKTPQQTGYVLDSSKTSDYSGNIDGDGTRKLKVYFKQQFSVTYAPGTKGTFSSTTTSNLDYNATTPDAPETTGAAGYTFNGWNPARETTVTATVTYTAQWSANTDTPYTVEYYYQTNGTYFSTPDNSVNRTGTTDTTATVTDEDKVSTQTGYVLDTSKEDDYSGNIDGDGTRKLKVYFKQQFSVTYASGTKGTFTETTTSNLDYNATTPNAPETTGADGYTFAGWDPARETNVTATVTYVAQWTANTNTPYTVEYYWQDTTGSGYTIHETVPSTGTTDTTANAEIKTYDGFTHDAENANRKESGNIDGSGNLVLKVYYNRNVHTVTYQYLTQEPANATPALPGVTSYRYGQTVNIATTPSAQGYTFSGWSRTESFAMPDENVVITGSFTAKGDTEYKVEHYWQNIDNNEYTIHETKTHTGETNTLATANPETYTGFTFDSNNGNNINSGNIEPDGSRILKLYYNRISYQVSYTYTNNPAGRSDLPQNASYRFGKTVQVANQATAPGYEFDGWYKGSNKVTSFEMPAEAVVLSGTFNPNTNTPYTVEYYYQTNGSYLNTPDSSVGRTGTTDTTAEVTDEDKIPQQTGYVLDSSKTSDYSGNIDGDGTRKLKVYFKQQFSVTYAPGTKGTFSSTTTSNLDYNADTPANPEITGQAGYSFANWDPQVSPKVTETVTYIAQWTANQNTPYTVEYYYQTNGSYSSTPDSSVGRTGTTDTTASLTDSDTTPTQSGYVYDTSASNVTSGNIEGDGNLKLKVYFKQQFSVTYQPGEHGTFNSVTTNNLDYGTTTPNAPETTGADGYTFNGWNPARESTVTGNKVYVAEWAPDTGTPYTIEYYLETLNNGYVKDDSLTDHPTGTTNETVNAPDPPKTITNYQFDSTNTNNVTSGTVASDGSLKLKLYYNLNVYTIKFNSTSGDTYNGDLVINDIEITKKHGETLALSEFPAKPTYDENLKQNSGESVNKRHNALLGWYTEETTGSKITEPITVTQDKEYYARWENVPIMCVKATSLHTEICDRTSNGCYAHGYRNGGSMGTTTIVYGNTAASSTPQVGDAYNCDINNDQVYDPVHERFYYYGAEDGKAKLIFYSNWDGEEIDITHRVTWADAESTIPNGLHTQWFNTDSVDNVKFLKKSDAQALCGTNFASCQYFLEQSAYQKSVDGVPEPKPFRSGIWLEKDTQVHRIQTSSLAYNDGGETQENAVKPVILVPNSMMDTTPIDTYNVSFHSLGGTFGTDGEIKVITVGKGGVIRIPPIPTKTNNYFDGWYTTETCDPGTELTNPILNVTEDTTYYAKWHSDTGNVAKIGNAEYTSLQEAINHVPTDGTATSIVLLKDVSNEDLVINGNRNVVLNFNNHTVSNSSATANVFTINTGAALTIESGTVTSDASAAMFNVNSGTLNLNGGTFNATGTGPVISNNSGTVEIKGNPSLTSSSTTTSTIVNNGSLQITRGDIISTGSSAISNESGQLVIGENGALRVDDPVIQGKTYGIVSKVSYDFYDGIVKGKTYPVAKASGDPLTITDDTNHDMITNVESEAIIVHGSETQGTDLYQTMYLKYYDHIYVITFDAGEHGIPQTQTIVVDRENPQPSLGNLPISNPTRPSYDFGGWYTGVDGTGEEVTSQTIPTSEATSEYPLGTPYITYYAKWIEKPVQEIAVTFISNGSIYTSKIVNEGNPLDEIPIPTIEGYYFGGWYTVQNTEGQAIQGDELLSTTVFNADATYYAYWIDLSNKEAYIENNGKREYYETLEAAITATPSNSASPTNIKLIKDIITDSREFYIDSNKNVILDMQNHLIKKTKTNAKSHLFIVNSGNTLELSNGTIEGNLIDGMLQANKGGTLKITSGEYKATGTRAAVVAEGGTVYISGSPSETIISATTNERPAVHINKESKSNTKGTANITGGTIISTGGYAIHNANGTLNIGTQGTPLSNESPVIQGKDYGIAAKDSFKFYDGIIKGGTSPVGEVTNQATDGWSITGWSTNKNGITPDTDNSTINEIETNTQLKNGNELIDATPYETLYLADENTIYVLSFNPGAAGNGATISNERLIIDRGDEIGVLPTASWDDAHTFDGWYTGPTDGTKISSTTVPTGDNVNITYYAHWNAVTPEETFTISFNANGGTGTMDDVSNLFGTYTLPTCTFTPPEGKQFEGWSLTADGEIITQVQMDQDRTVYAIWEDIPEIICRKATILNQEVCNIGDDDKTNGVLNGCRGAGIAQGAIIKYGQLTDSSEPGFALDCDVDGTGYNKRFYYLRTIDQKAVLIANENIANDINNYDTALTLLPNTNEWSNIPTSFEFTHPENGTYTKAARFVTMDDLKVAADEDNVTTTGKLDSINFIFENTKYANPSGKSTVWIQKDGNTRARYHRNGRNVATINQGATSSNSVRAVIEIPTKNIDYNYVTPERYTITYNAGSGTVDPTSQEYDAGSTVSSFPTPTYTDHIFDAWYDSNDTLVTSLVLTGDTTIYAHYADIDTSNVFINVNGTHNIFNTAPSSMSNYSIVSTDPNVATVNNGVITGVSAGTTTVTITSTAYENQDTIVINVEVDDVVNFTITSNAVNSYFNNVSTWLANDGNNQSAFESDLMTVFDANSCSKCGANECGSPTAGTYCDQPKEYDTGTTDDLNVYTDETKTKPVTYVTSTGGKIYNMIPGETYYWESANDPSINGKVKAEGERRVLKSNVRNLRDLGGMAISYTDGNVTKTGTLKYEKLYRGAQITSASGVTELEKLGIDREIDLRGNGEQIQTWKLDKYDIGTKNSYTDINIINYHINPEPTAYLPTESSHSTVSDVANQCNRNHLTAYREVKAALKQVMQDVVDGESVFFHCTIGTDRTGTLAYLLEGLLGVSEEDRLRDYELSFYFGLTNRSRFHDDYGSSVNPRFYSMYRSYPTNDDIYAWYTYERASDDDTLLAQFRQAMINYTN